MIYSNHDNSCDMKVGGGGHKDDTAGRDNGRSEAARTRVSQMIALEVILHAGLTIIQIKNSC